MRFLCLGDQLYYNCLFLPRATCRQGLALLITVYVGFFMKTEHN